MTNDVYLELDLMCAAALPVDSQWLDPKDPVNAMDIHLHDDVWSPFGLDADKAKRVTKEVIGGSGSL